MKLVSQELVEIESISIAVKFIIDVILTRIPLYDVGKQKGSNSVHMVV